MTGPEKSPEPHPTSSSQDLVKVRDLHEHAEKETKTLVDLLNLMARRIFQKDALLVLTILITGGLGALIGSAKAADWRDAGVEKGVAPVEIRVTKVEQELGEVKRTQQAFALEQVRSVTMLENLSRDRGLPVPPKTQDAGP